MTVLVLGASGQVGAEVVAGLTAAGVAVRAGMREPSTPQSVRFDWDAPATWAGALDGVRAVHLLPPQGDPDPAARVLPFLEQAEAAGVRRVVLLSASAIAEEDPGLGEVHAALARSRREWAVLRPSWFLQNFTGSHQQAQRIREHDEVVTATGTGRVGFVDVRDIAAVSVVALTCATSLDRELVLTGPETLSYDEVAAIIGRARGREVDHRAVDEATFADWLSRGGIPPAFAAVLARMDVALAAGAEDRVTDTVEQVTGRAPRSLSQLAAEHWA